MAQEDLNPIWVKTEDAAKALNLGQSTLRELQRSELTAGIHWAYVTGRPNGPIGWSLPAMTEWQTAATKRIVAEQEKAKQKRIARIEDYDAAYPLPLPRPNDENQRNQPGRLATRMASTRSSFLALFLHRAFRSPRDRA